MSNNSQSGFRFQHTRAAQMLSSALRHVSQEFGLSLRSVAKDLGYKQAVVLSHMASGRVAIPIERATQIARAVNLPLDDFLVAVVEQKAPEAADLLTDRAGGGGHRVGLVHDIMVLANSRLDDLSDERKAIMREVAIDAQPARRWLSPAELPIVDMLRKIRPEMQKRGLSDKDRIALESALRDSF